jgi:hypothetical protein
VIRWVRNLDGTTEWVPVKKPWEKGRRFRVEARCPYCGTVQDCHTAFGADKSRRPRRPREGDYAVCTDCAQVSVFDRELAMKPWPVALPLPDDVADVAAHRAAESRLRPQGYRPANRWQSGDSWLSSRTP